MPRPRQPPSAASRAHRAFRPFGALQEFALSCQALPRNLGLVIGRQPVETDANRHRRGPREAATGAIRRPVRCFTAVNGDGKWRVDVAQPRGPRQQICLLRGLFFGSFNPAVSASVLTTIRSRPIAHRIRLLANSAGRCHARGRCGAAPGLLSTTGLIAAVRGRGAAVRACGAAVRACGAAVRAPCAAIRARGAAVAARLASLNRHA
jgi:hypothetical protein